MATEPKKVVVSPTGLVAYFVILTVFYAVLVVTALLLTSFEKTIYGTTLNLGTTLLILLIPYTLFSFRIVDKDEIGALFFWGKPLTNLPRGPILVPLLVISLEKETRNIIQTEVPGEPEQIQRDDKVPLNPGEVRPIRGTTASKETCELAPFDGDTTDTKELDEWKAMEKDFVYENKQLEKDPLHKRLTLEPVFIIPFRVIDLIQFIEVIGSAEEAIRQIQDIVVTRAQSEFGRRTPTLIIKHFNWINKRIQRDVQILVGEEGDKNDDWGIDLGDSRMKLVGLTESVNKQIAAEANAEYQRNIDRLGGLGKGEARRDELANEAVGWERMAEALKSPDAKYALAMKTTENTISKTAQTIITNGAGADQLATMLGGAVGAASALANRPTPTPTPPKDEAKPKTEPKKKE